MASGLAAPPGHLPDELQLRREPGGRGRLPGATPTLADPPVRTLPLPADRDHAEPMGTPLLRLTPSPGDTPTAPTRSDALGDAAELRFADSVARYSHADWKREQLAEPTCHATILYISIGRPLALPPDFFTCYPSHKHPFLSDIQELAGKGRLHETDDTFVLLVRNPTLPPTTSVKLCGASCLLAKRRASSHLGSPAHAPLDHASLSLDGLLSSRHHARVAHAGVFVLAVWRQFVHPVVASLLLEVPSAEKPTADCPLAHDHNASAGRSRCHRQC